jgi:hypothetical protein
MIEMFDLEWPWIVIIIGFLVFIVARLGISSRMDAEIAVAARSEVMPIVVSIAVLGSALFVVLSGGYAEAEQKWAFGAIGTILGYWLKK